VYVNLGLHAQAVLGELAEFGSHDVRLFESLYRLRVISGRQEEAKELEDKLTEYGIEVEADVGGLRLYEY
jgi:hypothetical protein